MTVNRERWIVGLVVLGFIILALGFSLGPIFEGPDEIEHYRFIRTVQRTGTLPDPAGQPNGEYHQAPLYYLLMQPFAALLPDDFEQYPVRRNPYYGFRVSVPGNDNKNRYVHTSAEVFPYTENPTARAVHTLRLLSVVIGAGAVLASYAGFRTLWPCDPYRRLFALGIVAFWPQLAYMSSVINNDGLAILLATTSLWLVLRMQRRGPTGRSAILLAIVLGAALVTKASLGMMVIPLGLATLIDRRMWRYVPVILLLVAVIAGWWYARNALLYGDPTGIRSMLKAWPSLMREPGENGLVESIYAYFTVWARFGYGAVTVGDVLYRLFDVLVFFTIAGLLLRIVHYRRHRLPERMVLLPAVTLMLFALVWVISVMSSSIIARDSNHGRFLLPGIAAWAALQTLGLEMWMIPRWRRAMMAGGAIVLALMAVASLVGYFYPAYRSVVVPDSSAQPVRTRYGNLAELIGMSPADLQVRPGEIVALELYWLALQAGPPQLEVYVAINPPVESIARRSLPGNGHRPADDWQPGERWAERYEIVIPADLPEGARLIVSLYDPETGSLVDAVDMTNNRPLGTAPVIGQFVVDSDRG